jgi:two-component system, sensor histidine kinase and response regulator
MTKSQILIVDDDPALLEALSETLRLRMDDLEVDTTDSAPSALERIADMDYDAIVADIKMPGMDGLELLGEIKKVRPDTPTLLITGHGEHELAVQALRGGAHDYVQKPIDREYFVGSLRHAIQMGRLSRQVKAQKAALEEHAKELEECVHERTHELRDLLYKEATARAELDEANRKLTEAERQREELVSMIAHDLRGPLTAMVGYAEVLGRPDLSPDLHARARSIILSETRRMARLVHDLADSGLLATSEFDIQLARCDLLDIAREQAELVRVTTDRHSIEVDAPAGAMLAVCDRDRVAQLLANLLSNAVKYTPGGEIRVRVWAEGKEALLSVSDQGPGIPEDRLDTIFEPHVRLANDSVGGDPDGAGLGLHIAKGIVEAHGGRIWAESAPGRGATFGVSLPLAPTGLPRRSEAPASAER